MECLKPVLARFANGERTRILAFGSSNTEHFLPGMHWVDCLELGIVRKHGRVHTCINTGIGGNTAGMMLDRFDEDAAFYKPHVVLITVGGNDSFPDRNVTIQEYSSNLLEMKERFAEMGTVVIYQTYYSPDPDLSGDLSRFYSFMDVLRDVARETESGLIDHLARWELLRTAHPNLYKPLMQDGFHLNRRGNILFGLDLARAFGCELDAEDFDVWSEGLRLQGIMDQLEEG